MYLLTRGDSFQALSTTSTMLNYPEKVYLTPLTGIYYRNFNIGRHGGDRGQQVLAIVGTMAQDIDVHRPGPVLHLFGLASVSGVSRLHSELPRTDPRQATVHSLREVMDLDNVVPNLHNQHSAGFMGRLSGFSLLVGHINAR